MTRIPTAFNLLKWVRFALLFCAHFSAHAQPYEPTFLLDVTGEIGEVLGFNLQALGDQDGDGYDDIITSFAASEEVAGLRIYYGNNDAEIRSIEFGRFDSTGREFGWFDASFDAGFTVPAGDVNGDGHADIMRTLCVWYDDHCHLYPYLFLGGPGVFDTLADWSGVETVNEFITNVGDYNGDGRDDYTSRPLSAQYFGLFLGSEPPLSQVYEWEHTPNRSHMGFGDVNGDGFSDFGMSYFIGSQDLSRMDIFLGSADADSIPLVYQYGPGEPGLEEYGRIVGDVNGDSIDDIFFYKSSFEFGASKRVFFGSRNMDFISDDEFFWEGNEFVPRFTTPLGDINGDGFDDYAHHEEWEDFLVNRIEVWLGGNPLPRSPAWVLNGPFDGMNYPYRIGQAGDFNGDGIDDWFFSAYHGLEERGRIIVVAGDRDFGVSADERPRVAPSSFVLHPCYPNPFNSSVTIPLEVTGTGMQRVTLTILNTLGQIAYQFEQEQFIPGLHTLRWNGTSNAGLSAASGVFFLHVSSSNSKTIRKLLLIK